MAFFGNPVSGHGRDQVKPLYDIGLDRALSMVLGLTTLSPVTVSVEEACGLVAAEDLFATADCPSRTSSLKDGYAVISGDLTSASDADPVRLKIVAETSFAGGGAGSRIKPGVAVRVMTGAPLPEGADAVIPVEFTWEDNGLLVCRTTTKPGRNLLLRGTDVKRGQPVVSRGEPITPALAGLLAAGGIHLVQVFPRPRVAVVATGDEVVAPGHPLRPGQLYASNLVTLQSWLKHFGIPSRGKVARDRRKDLVRAFTPLLEEADVLITSGGTWKSDRDLTVKALDGMGWDLLFHRVRLRPGKAVAMGMLEGKPVFCLPGGPPSNEMAFLQLALPGLLKLAGMGPTPFVTRRLPVGTVVGGDPTWTRFFQAVLEKRGDEWWAMPLRKRSRLQSQARARAVIRVPEGVERIEAGDPAEVQVLFPIPFFS